eukprot:scaffold48625_cov21-Tisochrysis_lutea.AAC.2
MQDRSKLAYWALQAQACSLHTIHPKLLDLSEKQTTVSSCVAHRQRDMVSAQAWRTAASDNRTRNWLPGHYTKKASVGFWQGGATVSKFGPNGSAYPMDSSLSGLPWELKAKPR